MCSAPVISIHLDWIDIVQIPSIHYKCILFCTDCTAPRTQATLLQWPRGPSLAFKDMQIHLLLERNSGSRRRVIKEVATRIAHGPAPQLTLTLFTQQKCGTMLPSPSHPPLRTLYGLCSAKIPVTTVRMFAVSGVLQDGPSRSCTVRGEGHY